MAAVVAEFFNVIGVDMTPPSNLAELIPWLACVVIGVKMVSLVFGMIRDMVASLFFSRRF